jgi:hypothetical protein
MLETLAAQTAAQGEVECVIAGKGYFSAHNMQACEAAQIEPLMAVARENRHPDWREPSLTSVDLCPEASDGLVTGQLNRCAKQIDVRKYARRTTPRLLLPSSLPLH